MDKNKRNKRNGENAKTLHGNYARIDPHAELTSAFFNQAITQVEGYEKTTPMPGEVNVIRAKNWVDENKK